MATPKSLVRAAVAVAGATMLVAAGSTTASATPVAADSTTASAATARNGVCETGEFCLYFLPNRRGSVSDFATSVPNYGTTQPTCYDFKGPGAGQGQCVKNNAESAWNRRSGSVRVYFNSNYGGSSDLVAANSWRNLSATFDNNASHRLF